MPATSTRWSSARPSNSRLRHLAGPATGQARLLREALTHNVWEARIIRSRRQGQSVHPDGHPDPRGRELSTGRRVDQAGWRDRPGDRGPRLGRPVLGRQSPEDAAKYRDIVSVRSVLSGSSTVPRPASTGTLWLGPAPARPFHEVYIPGRNGYRWWDFGNGTMSDLGSHWMDLPFWAPEARRPLRIEAAGPPPHRRSPRPSMRVAYEYGPPGRDARRPGSGGTRARRSPPLAGERDPQVGKRRPLHRSKGMLLSNYGKHLLLPEKDFRDYKTAGPLDPKSLGHPAEWIHACKTGAPTTATSITRAADRGNHLGTSPYRTGKPLEWDHQDDARPERSRGRPVHPSRIPEGLEPGVIPARRNDPVGSAPAGRGLRRSRSPRPSRGPDSGGAEASTANPRSAERTLQGKPGSGTIR